MSLLASSPSATQEAADRRKSGRASRKPELFAEEHHEGSLLSNRPAKRKRPSSRGDGPGDSEDDENDGSDSQSESSADEEELKEQRRRAKNAAAVEPNSKRPRVSEEPGPTLAFRSAKTQSKGVPQKSKVQKARSRQSQAHQEGLYAEVFGRGYSGSDAAAGWFQRYETNNLNAMCEMVNFVLQCTGCKAKVTVHDIEDVDNIPNKLSDLQEEYQGVGVTDYPLVSKQKEFVAFRQVLVDFFSAVIRTMHNSSALYDDAPLFENIQIWVDTMSSAGIRPFRHTATLIALNISTAFCETARDLESAISVSRRQTESERKKKKVNQARVQSMQEKIEEDEKKLEAVENLLKDEFDVVFVHRYRDVDPKIRVECVAAMGAWILTYRKMFLEGQYLRYLGWVLSDTAAQTRSEVVKQLNSLFKNPNNIGPLRSFADRFRSRMVEIAARDAEPGVRADAIDLLDHLRDAELLEPDEIDVVGRLIFDAESRVRKAVAKFFVSNLEDLYKVSMDSIDEEQLSSVLPEAVTGEDYLLPSQTWIKFKCLAGTLLAYAGNEDGSRENQPTTLLVAGNVDSRYMLATQAVFSQMPELQEWESLAGYLLYDHSSISSDPDDEDAAAAVQAIYQLEEGEDSILLEVLDYSVKLYLLQVTDWQTENRKKGRKTQASREDAIEKQETIARHLTMIVPQLLNKYGSLPRAATAILRLQHLLDMDLVNELQQSESTYAALLDDINRQFMTHSDRSVLAEASFALMKAKGSDPAKEAVDAKMQEMWDENLGSLQNLLRGQNIETRGTLSSGVLEEVSNTVSRISSLASISDCASILETALPASSVSKKQKSRSANATPLEVLLQLCRRGISDDEAVLEFYAIENELVTSAIKTLLFYFMWKIQSLRTAISTSHIRALEHSMDLFSSLSAHRNQFATQLHAIIQSRLALDPLRLLSLSTALDLYTLFSTLRHAKPDKESQKLSPAVRKRLDELIEPIPSPLQVSIMASHGRLESNFAKKSQRKLEPGSSNNADANNAEQGGEKADSPAPDAPPVDSDSEDENEGGKTAGDAEDSDDGAVEEKLGSGREGRRAQVLLAEQSLCEFSGKMVLGLIAGVMDAKKYKARLLTNKTKLGPNYKEVLAYLEDKSEKKRDRGVKGKGKGKSDAGEKQREKERAKEKEKEKLREQEAVLLEDDIEDDEGQDAVDELDRDGDEGNGDINGDNDDGAVDRDEIEADEEDIIGD